MNSIPGVLCGECLGNFKATIFVCVFFRKCIFMFNSVQICSFVYLFDDFRSIIFWFLSKNVTNFQHTTFIFCEIRYISRERRSSLSIEQIHSNIFDLSIFFVFCLVLNYLILFAICQFRKILSNDNLCLAFVCMVVCVVFCS